LFDKRITFNTIYIMHTYIIFIKIFYLVAYILLSYIIIIAKFEKL